MNFSCTPNHRRRGVALVIVLGFLVLLTGLVVAFFSRATTSRMLSDSSLYQTDANQLALSATDVILGDLLEEIEQGSNVTTPASGVTIFEPQSSLDILPRRNVAATPGNDPFPNLIRISQANDSIQAPGVGSRASEVNSTDDISRNGRSISLARWNRHYLIPRVSGADPSDTEPVVEFTAPDWVMVTSDEGPDENPADLSKVVGRYAYAIYDEGGLLDVNVAGYPAGATADQYGNKPALAYADLREIGFSDSAVDDLVGWRNYASAQPDGSFGSFTLSTSAQLQRFFDFVTENPSGFMEVADTVWNSRTDQVFTSRQQLLDYRASAGVQFSADALQYLGTFSRDVDAPIWKPQTPTGSSIDYAAIQDNPTSANRKLLNVRVTGGFTRPDGTVAEPGDPLLKRRFPLGRLAGLGPEGVVTAENSTMVNGVLSPASAETIQRDFGLVWNGDHWDYCGPTGNSVQNSIAVLGAIGNREPNFFELLKASILSGSLGKDAGPNGTYLVNYEQGPASGIQADDANVDFQVIKIGANIIDQSDTDSYPTEIRFDTAGTAFHGIENLPYLQRVFAKNVAGYTDTTSAVEPQPTGVAGWFMAEIWNPHQNFGYTDPSAIPTEFRFRGEGLTAMFLSGPPISNSGSLNLANSGYLEFSVPWNSTSCREPTFLADDTSNGANLVPTVNSGSNGPNVYWGGLVAGLYAGFIATTSPYPSVAIEPQGCDLHLEYQAPNGSWRVYDTMRNLTGKHDWNPSDLSFYYQRVDPRTDRFGTTLGQWIYDGSVHRPGDSIRDDTGPGWKSYDYFPDPEAGFIYPSNDPAAILDNFYMGTLSDNTSGSNPYYTDPDGVLRSAAGNYSTGDDGRPLMLGNNASRPIILNRPFRNVGELGYAFRDLPWKNIDFFTDNSADAALLDVFCVQDTATDNAMVAGRVNLNTRQAPVLEAIIHGGMIDEVGAATVDNYASDVAADIVALTTGTGSGEGPFLDRSELVTRASTILMGSNATADQQIKMRREAALRALSEVGATRTWNLMIDVIAQTGRFAQGQTELGNFVVEGEKRYWVHVAIDRLTGQVIDRQVESVYE